jgi:hypothetical protein
MTGCAGLTAEQKALNEGAAAALRLLGRDPALQGQTLKLEASAVARLPFSDRKLYTIKATDAKGGLHGAAVDTELRRVDLAVALADDRSQRLRQHGALDGALVDRLKSTPVEPLRVLLWLADAAPVSLSRPDARGERIDAERIESLYQRVEQDRMASVERLAASVLERVRGFDREARSAAPAPMIMAKLDAAALRELSRDRAIDRIYLDLPAQPELAVAKVATGIAQLQQQGMVGQGIRVAAINAGGGLVEAGSLVLRPVVQDPLFVCANQVDPHATSVVGAMIARRITIFGQTVGEEGAAPGLEVRAAGSCTTDSMELMTVSTRAVTWGARVLNLSWGLDTRSTLGAVDRFYDDLVFNRWRGVVKSAGNRPCLPIGGDEVTSPGLAYNVVTVGGYDDRRTNDLGDDVIDPCASFGNPVSLHGDRQKPELAAPSVDVEVVTAGPANLQRVTGTSIAAPQVTAAAALLIERNGRLSTWPEIVRALLMATATHNVEGNRRLSDRDGAGGVRADIAAQLASDTGRWNGLRYNCDTSTPSLLPLVTVPASPGTRHRVVLSWSTDPADTHYGSQPSADIDLSVVDANGRTMASSMSFDNSFEIVEFDVVTAGSFTLRAHKFRCDSSVWLGWAWHTAAAVP